MNEAKNAARSVVHEIESLQGGLGRGAERTRRLGAALDKLSVGLEKGPAIAGGGKQMPLLRREELAEVLQVSLRTLDTMVMAGELPFLRLKGFLVRFYLPDVVRHLTATAVTSKRRWPGPRGKGLRVDG